MCVCVWRGEGSVGECVSVSECVCLPQYMYVCEYVCVFVCMCVCVSSE